MTSFVGVWPLLSDLGFSAAELADRASFIGGTDANTILSGDDARVLNLWQEKTGKVQGEDLSGVLQVVLGQWTETFNRLWYMKQTGLDVTEVNKFLRCQKVEFRAANLDGFVEAKGAIWEAKHTSAFAKPEEIVGRYMPQLQHNMAVRGVDFAVLSVIYGNHKWETYEVPSDWMYQDELLEAEHKFWRCVQTDTPPVEVSTVTAPKPLATREVSMEGNNLWSSLAGDWLKHKAAAKTHADAVKGLKELIEDDVSRAYGHGLEAKRSKAGAISFKELAA